MEFTEALGVIFKFLKHPNFCHQDLEERWKCLSELATANPGKFGERFDGLKLGMLTLLFDPSKYQKIYLINICTCHLKSELENVLENSRTSFDRALDTMDVVIIRNELNLIECVMETNGICNDSSYSKMKRKFLDKFDEFVGEFLSVEFHGGGSNKNLLQFDKFFDDLSWRFGAVGAVSRELLGKFEGEKDFVEVEKECERFLDGRIDAQVERGDESLRMIVEEEGEDNERTKEFIAIFYNLVSFEKKMPKLEAGKLEIKLLFFLLTNFILQFLAKGNFEQKFLAVVLAKVYSAYGPCEDVLNKNKN